MAIVEHDRSQRDAGRYSRQIIVPGFGSPGQASLRSSRVVVAGLGGLGGTALVYLARAGVGSLSILDCQDVEESNLNRQILYDEADVGQSKCRVAARRIREIDSSIQVEATRVGLNADNARELISGANAVIDGFDTLESKLLLNDACIAENIPLVHAGIYAMQGNITTVVPGKSPCLRCIYPKTPHNAERKPVVGSVAGLVACVQATECIKLLTSLGEPLLGRMLYLDLKAGNCSIRPLVRNRDCRVCGCGSREWQ